MRIFGGGQSVLWHGCNLDTPLKFMIEHVWMKTGQSWLPC